jgi:hypothetical protein
MGFGQFRIKFDGFFICANGFIKLFLFAIGVSQIAVSFGAAGVYLLNLS